MKISEARQQTKSHYKETPFDFQKIRERIFKFGLTYSIFINNDFNNTLDVAHHI